ncbi:hypothetical protein EDC96DRAFT_417671, partial [Choanephora cucurbitarum]
LGWLPSRCSASCPIQPSRSLTEFHALYCPNMHHRLMMPETIVDLLSFLLNLL